MAQATKSKRTSSRSKGRGSAAKKSASSKATRARKGASSKAKRAGSSARKTASEVPNPADRGANAMAAAAHAAKGTKAAGQAVGALALRARKPLILGGAAAAGVAGGLAFSKRR